MNATMNWSGKQWIVVITDGKQTIEIPLDDFIQLPAIKGIRADAVMRANEVAIDRAEIAAARRP